MRISEPMTLLTDYLLVVLCVVWGRWLLVDAGRRGSRAERLWGGFFLAAAVAAFAGGTSHGFVETLGETGWRVAWKITVLATGCASFLLLAAAIQARLGKRWRRPALAAAALKLALYAAWMLGHDEFLYVILDYGSASVVVLLLEIWAWMGRREAASPWIVGGILIAFAGAAVQQSGLSPHPHFNHNDLYHVIQAVSFYLLYRGGLLLTDRE